MGFVTKTFNWADFTSGVSPCGEAANFGISWPLTTVIPHVEFDLSSGHLDGLRVRCAFLSCCPVHVGGAIFLWLKGVNFQNQPSVFYFNIPTGNTVYREFNSTTTLRDVCNSASDNISNLYNVDTVGLHFYAASGQREHCLQTDAEIKMKMCLEVSVDDTNAVYDLNTNRLVQVAF